MKNRYIRLLTFCYLLAAALTLGLSSGFANEADQAGRLIKAIRDDHPRLLYNRDDIPQFRRQAGRFSDHFEALRQLAEKNLPESSDSGPATDFGHDVLNGAIVYQVTGSEEMLERITAGLHGSLRFYHERYGNREPVNWYAWSRLSWLVALDMIWNSLAEEERVELSESFIRHMRDYEEFGRRISREGTSGANAGFYGASALFWFAGLLFHGEEIDDAQALSWLETGYSLYHTMLENRQGLVGDDGGSVSGTLSYSLQDYPFSEWNFFHSVRAATGYDIAQDWAYVRLFPEYIWWNWLPGGLEFGYGDTPHTTNRLPGNSIPTHMAHLMHFYSETFPEAAAKANHIRQRALEEGFARGGVFRNGFRTTSLSIYPYLLGNMDKAPEARRPVEDPPLARFFSNMGQTFIRTGSESGDTFVLISAGGNVTMHRHHDAGHFTLFHRGFLAIDSGTRINQTSDHMFTYYSQSIAHNTLLIDMPGEEPPRYWGRPADVASGGQYRTVGSQVTAFESHDEWAYLATDLTPVYHPDKSESVIREFVFIRPNALLIFDRVRSTDAGYAKTWLLHTVNEPEVENRRWQVEHNKGRMIATTLLPADARVEAVGGPGREFLVAGQNYPFSDNPDAIRALMGRWRVEVTPGAARQTDRFLHLLETGDRTLEAMDGVKLLETEERTGVQLSRDGEVWEILFNSGEKPGGRLRHTASDGTVRENEFSDEVQP